MNMIISIYQFGVAPNSSSAVKLNTITNMLQLQLLTVVKISSRKERWKRNDKE